jgi:hypothetical protein
MSKSNQYKWLIVVEGITDKETYRDLLSRYGIETTDIAIFSAHGKPSVCNAEAWDNIRLDTHADLITTVKTDIGRTGFEGIILIVDSDTDSAKAFDSYKRRSDGTIPYATANKPTINQEKGGYWNIDSMRGLTNTIPILGITVPTGKPGCLETDLLSSYGFPVEGQQEYSSFVDIIQKVSCKWQIPKHGDGKDWWEENKKAKLDKFIYSALSHGFKANRESPTLPAEPDVITRIKSVIAQL